MRNILLFAIIVLGAATVRAAPVTEGVNHIGLTVTKLDATARFFIEALGWEKAGELPDYPAIFVTDGEAFVTLWQATDPASAVAFNRKTNVGLHHMAMTVGSLEALHALHRKLAAREDVTIEFAPEFMGDGPTTHMMVRGPSGLRLEFIVPASRIRTTSGE